MTTESPQHRPSMRVAGLRAAVALTGVLAVLAGVVAALTGGQAQVVGALSGVALVGAFFLFGTLSTSLVAAFVPRAALVVALLTYTLQVLLLALVLVGISRSGVTEDELDVRWLAATVIVGTLVWTGALVADAVRNVPADEPSTTSTDEVTSTGEVRR